MRAKNYVSKYRLSLVAEKGVRYPIDQRVSQPERAADLFFQVLKDSPREQTVVLFCNVKWDITGYLINTQGTKNRSLVDIGEVFSAALHADAHSIIFGHNHPSGYVEPSDLDKNLTKRLRSAGKLLDVELTDHIIVASGTDTLRYYSFAKNNWE